jgi:DNA-binding NtrC family response regulator
VNKKRETISYGNILVVDDSEDMLEVLRRNLTMKGYKVYTVTSAEEAITMLESTPVDLVITDLKMPGIGGIELIRHVRANFRNIEVLVITGFPSIQGAVDAVKTGAEEYLVKSFTDEELYSAVDKAFAKISKRRTNEVNLHLKTKSFHGIIGESKPMQKVFESIKKISRTNATVLLTGESGTGKELVARAIHYDGPRASYPFVPVNCGSIPEDLIESELFGHLKGTFTGATETRGGFFHTADRGTIFLDEISNTPLSMQIKLLRVLQDQEIYMIGAKKSQKVDVRVIAATNVDLSELVQKEKFREDLFYRLNVLTIDIPPLRERGNDILLLIRYYIRKYAEEASKPLPDLTDKAVQVLRDYHWFGNVRELQNILQRLVIMTEEQLIDVPDLPAFMRYTAMKEKGVRRSLEEVESEYILNVLADVNNNKTHAAEILGIDRKTLREKLKRMGPGFSLNGEK